MTKPRLNVKLGIGCAVLCVLTIFVVWAWRVHLRPISLAELDRAYADNNTLLTSDHVYESPNGYSILIPTGYTYTPFKSGQMSLMAFNKPSGLMISKHWAPSGLYRSISGICNALQRKNETYSFLPEEAVEAAATHAIRRDFTVRKQGVNAKGIVVWFKIDNTLYQLMLNCPEKDFATFSSEYEKIVDSLKVN